jgi:hypothetical protein
MPMLRVSQTAFILTKLPDPFFVCRFLAVCLSAYGFENMSYVVAGFKPELEAGPLKSGLSRL